MAGFLKSSMLVVKALPQIAVLAVHKSKSNDIAPSPSGKAGDFDSIPKDGCIISDLYEAFRIVGDSMILKAFFFSKFNRKICCAGQKEIF